MAHSRRTGSAGRRAAIAVLAWVACGTCLAASGGVFLRVQLKEPGGATYHVRLGGYIHNDPWYLPPAVIPEGADRDPARRLPSGRFTPWFDVAKHAGKLLHGRRQRSGGVAEFPNVTLTFAVDPPSKRLAIRIELATSPDEGSVVRRFDESFEGTLTSVLVSPDLAHDAESLETATMMGERRVSWAQRASGGERHSPRQLILQTSLWAPQGPEPNRLEAEVLYLLGFNVVGNQTPEARALGVFREPGQTHDVDIGPSATKDAIEATWKGRGARPRREYAGTPFNFADEVCARPPIGRDPAALANFRAWIVARAIPASELGVARIEDLLPIETPAELEERKKADGERAARRVFYFTSRFRQEAAGERLKWNSDAFHRHIDEDAVTSTLVADHPYFSGTGLGMGIEQNWTWGGHPLALDWFGVARTRAVDCIGIEDWMGLQFMYGPDSTWEGFQLMGFQAAIFRSGSRGALPIIAWITPSDERNLRLKSASALCQGATHFFYWTYGPTATSTENYWSDLRSAYDGIVAIARGLAAAEHILAPGQTRRTRLALLYSISSDLW